MKNRLNTEEVGQLLARSTQQIDDSILAGLRAARMAALQRQRIAVQPGFSAWLRGLLPAPLHRAQANWGVALLLLAILLGSALYWQKPDEHDHAEIDLAILIDELPVEMYVD